MTSNTSLDRYRALRLLGVMFGLSVILGACSETTGSVATPTRGAAPEDYRLRHPITVQEADRSIVLFVGHARGGLSATQRADVIGLARTWVTEGTGAIIVDVPANTSNARAAESAVHVGSGLRISDLRSRTRTISRTNPTTTSAVPISVTWRRWWKTRRTSCSRARKLPPTRRGVPKALTNTARVRRPRPIIPKPTRPNSAIQANDLRA